MGYKIVGCSGTTNKVHGAATNVISTGSAIGNDGVGNAEAAGVVDAAAAVRCRIPGDGGIGEDEGAEV